MSEYDILLLRVHSQQWQQYNARPWIHSSETPPLKSKEESDPMCRLSVSSETGQLHRDSVRVKTLKTWSHSQMIESVAAVAAHIPPLLQSSSKSLDNWMSFYDTPLFIRATGFPARLSSLGQRSSFIPVSSSLSFKDSIVLLSKRKHPCPYWCRATVMRGQGQGLCFRLQVGRTHTMCGLNKNGPHRLIGSSIIGGNVSLGEGFGVSEAQVRPCSSLTFPFDTWYRQRQELSTTCLPPCLLSWG